jgi:hypothetical protein
MKRKDYKEESPEPKDYGGVITPTTATTSGGGRRGPATTPPEEKEDTVGSITMINGAMPSTLMG